MKKYSQIGQSLRTNPLIYHIVFTKSQTRIFAGQLEKIEDSLKEIKEN